LANNPLYAFNRGIISPLALARQDLERTALSAETMTNWIPRNLGSMMLRPGTAYIGATASNNQAKFIPFVFSQTDTALLEITNVLMRVWVSDALVTRPTVTAAVTDGTFVDNSSTNAAWSDKDESGGTSAFDSASGDLGLTGDGTGAAIREQEVTLVESGIVHALDIVIERGPVVFRLGSTSLDDNIIGETTLCTGTHSLSFTPTTNFFIQFQNREKRQVLVNSCVVASSGTMTLVAPWATADLSELRWEQSGDVVYIAADGTQQYKIERRSTTSWSVVKYEPIDGPFSDINITTITLAPAALTGNTTLAASKPLFKSTDVGSLVRVTSTGQKVTASITAENNFTNAIKVTGVATQRIFTIIRSNTWVATVTLQRSLDSATSGFADVTTYTNNATITFDDTLDNQIAWYRIGVKTSDFTSGTVDLTLDYAIGSIDGICRVTTFTTNILVSVEVITDFGGTTATTNWYPADWSTRKGYPTSVAFVEGRLGWGGRDKVWLSVSDAYESFDDTVIGDSGTIRRTIGSGPVDRVNWMKSVRRLVLGTDGEEHSMRASAEDEILTPSNAMIKSFSTQGSAAVQAVKIDNTVIFVQKGGTRIMQTIWGQDYEYETADLTTFFPEAGDSIFTAIAPQRQPDTRIHCLRTDGSVMILSHDRAENIAAWSKYTGGTVEDIVVLPGAAGATEDAVYYIVKRTINSSTVRYLEKWSLESQNQGGTTSRQSDSHIIATCTAGTITGLTTLEGETVTIWGNGKDLGTGTVSSNQLTGVSENGSNFCVGIAYTAQWKSAKLGPLVQMKNIRRLGVILHNTHYQGLQYGPTFTDLDNLPLVSGNTIADDTVHSTFDEESFEFDGNWDADSRLCLQAASPRPCTILAAIVGIKTNEK